MVALMAAVYLLQGVFTAAHGIIMIRVGQHFVADIRAALFRHFKRFPWIITTGTAWAI